MRPLPLALIVAGLLGFPAAAAAHELFDHDPPGQAPSGPANPGFRAGGDGATWSLLGTLATGNPHSDLDFFTKNGETYAAVGTLGTGPNAGGITIAQLTDKGKATAPRYVAGHGSATCFSRPDLVLSLQHDIEATPKGGVLTNTFLPTGAPTQEAQLLIDATDAPGRCHDQGTLGVQNVPQGGLEIVDITNPALPEEIGMTTHIGEAHTVNVDPRRPHIAYAVTSDSVAVGTDGKRENETSATSNALDGFEVVDMKSCMYFPASASIADKREACKPVVYRYRYESLDIVQGHTRQNQIYGCHELEVYPEDKLTCGSGSAMIVFDIKKMFNDNGTPDDFTDDGINGTPLPCERRASSSAGEFNSGAKVVDCGAPKFRVQQWLKDGAPSAAGVEHVGSAFHMGRTATNNSATPPYGSGEDIDFDHEAEFTTSRKFVFATDERGGGVTPPGAACPTSPADNAIGNGGLHAYAVDRLQKATPKAATAPERAKLAWEAYAKTSKGTKAIYRAPIRTQPQGSLCTAHVFQQIPGQNRIFMGYYSQGTQVIDFTENPNGTIDFKEAGFFIPANANQWVSSIFKAQREPDGRFTYFGATGDFNIGAAGRSAIDVFSVTLPAPPTPAGGTGAQGEPPPRTGDTTGSAAGRPCRETAGLRTVSARGRGRALRIGFERLARGTVDVDVFRQSQGTRVTGERRVARFRNRSSSFTWNGRGAGDGTYVVRYRMPLSGGRTDVRRVAVERRGGRWFARPDFYRRASCDLLQSVKLERPVFGGRSTNALLASFTLRRSASVTVVVRDSRGKVVRRFAPRTYVSGRTHRLRVRASLVRKGLTRVEFVARGAQTQSTATLAARRL